MTRAAGEHPGDPPRRSPEGPARRRLLVGIGAPDRGDDAVGPAAVGQVAEWVEAGGPGGQATPPGPGGLPVGTHVLRQSDPSRLLDEMAGMDLVVVVDAVRTGAAPGTVHVLETGAGRPPLPGDWSRAEGSHGFGVGHALELARALGRLPARVVLVGVEGIRFEVGAAPCEAVRSALAPAARAALAALGPEDGDLGLGPPPVGWSQDPAPVDPPAA